MFCLQSDSSVSRGRCLSWNKQIPIMALSRKQIGGCRSQLPGLNDDDDAESLDNDDIMRDDWERPTSQLEAIGTAVSLDSMTGKQTNII